MKAVIIKELEQVNERFGKPRKTNIIEETLIEVATEDLLIEDYNVKFFLSNEGYLKKIPLISLRNSGNTAQKLKDDDYITQEIEGSNKSELLLFSNKHVVYKVRAYELEDKKASILGDYLKNLLGLADDEKIIYMAVTEDYAGHMLFFFKNGKCAKVPLESYQTKTNRKQLANAYSSDDKLVHIEFIKEEKDLIAVSNINKVLVFNTAEISVKTTRNSVGIQVLKSKKGSTLSMIKQLEQVNFKSTKYYKSKIPAIGTFLKKDDSLDRAENLTLFLEE